MRGIWSRRVSAATLTVALAVAASACGDQQQGEGFARVGSGDVVYAGAALDKTEIIEATSKAATRAGSVHVVMTITGEAEVVARGDVAYRGRRPMMAMRMSVPELGPQKITMRFVGGKFYLRVPGMTRPGTFLAIDPKDRRSALGRAFADTTGQLDPVDSLRKMRAAVRSVDRVGKGTVAGTPVEHYKLRVETAAVRDQLGAAARKLALPETLVYDLWLDKKSRIRRMTFGVADTDVEVLLSRWGKPVRVSAPDPASVLTAPQR